MPSGNPNIREISKATQFKPGNPGGGKPKGSKHISTWIQELLNDEEFEDSILDSSGGLVKFKGAPIKAIILATRHKAVNGDKDAREWLAKYGWKQQAELDVTSNGETVAQPVDMDMLTQFMLTVKDGTKR